MTPAFASGCAWKYQKAEPKNIAIWGKPPDVPLTPEEYALREPFWNEWVGNGRKQKKG